MALAARALLALAAAACTATGSVIHWPGHEDIVLRDETLRHRSFSGTVDCGTPECGGFAPILNASLVIPNPNRPFPQSLSFCTLDDPEHIRGKVPTHSLLRSATNDF